jgi:hypothetical protein
MLIQPCSDIPYAPSFILSLTGEVDPRLRNVIDFAFLGGFSHPTLAVLCQPEQTWTACAALLLRTFSDSDSRH